MGGIIVPNTKISGAKGNPGIPFSDSPFGGIYETANGGFGISLGGEAYFELDSAGLLFGYKSTEIFALSKTAGAPFAATLSPNSLVVSPNGAFVVAVNDSSPGVIEVFSRNSVDGSLTLLSSKIVVSNPGSVAFSPDGKYVYVGIVSGNNTVGAYAIDSVSGILTELTGSPFALTANVIDGLAITPDGNYLLALGRANGILSVCPITASGVIGASTDYVVGPGFDLVISPDGAHVYVVNHLINSIGGYTINSATGVVAAIAGSPFATGANPQSIAITSDGLSVYVANLNDNTISAFSRDPTTGALSPIAGSPFATGAFLPMWVAVSPDGKHVYVANKTSSSMTVFSRDTSGVLAAIAGSPFATANAPICVASSPEGLHLYLSCQGAVQIDSFQTVTTPKFNLITAEFDATSGLLGVFNINGLLTSVGQPVLNLGYADKRFAKLAGLITQAFSAKTLTLDHAAGGLIGTPAADNAIAGAVGEYLKSIVLPGAAVALATGIAADVTSLDLTAGDWDIYGTVAHHSSGTTNVNDLQSGISLVTATLPADPNAIQCDYLTIVVPAAPDTADAVPAIRLSLAAPATVYLVTLAHFTVSTLTAYGKIWARRRR